MIKADSSKEAQDYFGKVDLPFLHMDSGQAIGNVYSTGCHEDPPEDVPFWLERVYDEIAAESY